MAKNAITAGSLPTLESVGLLLLPAKGIAFSFKCIRRSGLEAIAKGSAAGCVINP